MIREIFSKHFGQPPPQQLYVASVPVLLAYNYGLYTGILVDVGESSTRVTPMVDGYIVRDAIQTSTQLSGFNVTEILTQRLLQQQSNVFCLLTPSYMHSLAEKLKQQHGTVPMCMHIIHCMCLRDL
jgi:actin-related protein 4